MGTLSIPDDLVRAAMADPGLRGRVILKSKRREPLVHGSDIVGFVTPHETKSGWRAGPIYVAPRHRGHRHVEDWYRAHGDRVWVAFVADGNRSSLSMHLRAGFAPWKKARGGQWLKRESR